MLSLRFNQLLVVRKIYETGSLSAAAHQLHLTISAVSRALSKCQEEFGDELFVRNYQGMAPTEKCRSIIPVIDRVLADFGELAKSRTFEPSEVTRTLSIAAADNAVVMILRPVLRMLYKSAPKKNFRLAPLSENMLRELAEGSIDLALLPDAFLKVLPEHYYSLKLFDVHRCCLLRRDHPLALRTAQGKKLTHTQRKLIEVPHFLGAPYFLEDTDATLVLPHTTAEFFAKLLPNLTVIPIPGEKHVYSTRLIWHERTHASSEMQWIRSVFVSALRPTSDQSRAECQTENKR